MIEFKDLVGKIIRIKGLSGEYPVTNIRTISVFPFGENPYTQKQIQIEVPSLGYSNISEWHNIEHINYIVDEEICE